MKNGCGNPGAGDAFSSTCGPFSVRVKGGLTDTTWHFGPENELVGAVVVDREKACTRTYGEDCTATSPARDACHVNVSCPARPLDEYCSEAAEPCITMAAVCQKSDVNSGRSACNGYAISVGYGAHQDMYSFDSERRLTGVRFGSDTVLSCEDGTRGTGTSYGQVCEFAVGGDQTPPCSH